MNIHQQKLAQLVDRLNYKTASGRLDWESSSDKSVHVNLYSTTIQLRSDIDATGQDAVRVNVFDKQGELKLSFDDTALTYTNSDGDNVYYFVMMKNLLEAATRHASGEDKILDQILEELDDDPPF